MNYSPRKSPAIIVLCLWVYISLVFWITLNAVDDKPITLFHVFAVQFKFIYNLMGRII